MPLQHALVRRVAHGLQGFGSGLQAFAHGLRQGLHIARREQPAVLAVLHQFGNARHVGGKHGPMQGHGFHDDHRQPLREARQHQGAGGLQLGTHLFGTYPAGDAHLLLQTVLRHQPFDVGAHLAIARQHQLQRMACVAQQAGGFHQQHLPLLFTQAAHTHQAGGQRYGHLFNLVESGVQPTVHHLHLGPLGVGQPPPQLATPIAADGHHKAAVRHLAGQVQRLRLVKFFRPMHGEAVSRAPQGVCQHDHFGRIGAKVGVQVAHRVLLQPAHQLASLGQVDQVQGPGPVRPPAGLQAKFQGRQKAARCL